MADPEGAEVRTHEADNLIHVYAQRGGRWRYRAFRSTRPAAAILEDIRQGLEDPTLWPVQEPPAEAKPQKTEGDEHASQGR